MPMKINMSNPLQASADKVGEPQPDMTTTAQEVVQTANQKAPEKPEVDPKVKKRNDKFLSWITSCKTYRRKLIANWTINIDYRRGKPFISQTDEDQVAVNLDWSMTKSKQAALFSQVPHAHLNHSPDTLPKGSPWAASFERKLNDYLVLGGVESAMDECLPDVINAAGIGAVLVSFESMTEEKQVPSVDISAHPQDVQDHIHKTGSMPDGTEVPMSSVPQVVDHRYQICRMSPSDLLWPIGFIGSNFDNAPWIGRSGRVTWAQAVHQFNLKESDKDSVCGEDRPVLDKLTHDVDRDKIESGDETVGFDEIFYKEYQYDETAKSYSTIHRLVFVGGKDEPVIDEAWKGQKVQEDGSVIGAQRFPIRVLTLAYITDETIPPSDSAIGRPQVNEINKARTQMIKQRERSLPVRWMDVNRVDPAIQQGLMRGTWQAMIPVQGDGNRAIGEVSRASMPPENFMFDKIAKSDLQEEWAVGPTAAQMVEAAGDPSQNKQAFNTQAGRERARVGSFFVGIAEVLGGLMCLNEDPSSFGQGFDPAVSKLLKCSILADSTVLLDAGQKLTRLNQFINTYAKSGWINIEPLLQEAAALSGLDPTIVVKAPSPKPPVEPNISLRLTGVEDLMTPLALAMMIKSGQAPTADLIEQAKQLIQSSVTPPPNPQPGTPPPGGQPPQVGPDGQPLPPQSGPPQGSQGPLPSAAGTPGAPPGTPGSQPPPPPKIGEAHPNWTVHPTLDKRSNG